MKFFLYASILILFILQINTMNPLTLVENFGDNLYGFVCKIDTLTADLRNQLHAFGNVIQIKRVFSANNDPLNMITVKFSEPILIKPEIKLVSIFDKSRKHASDSRVGRMNEVNRNSNELTGKRIHFIMPKNRNENDLYKDFRIYGFLEHVHAVHAKDGSRSFGYVKYIYYKNSRRAYCNLPQKYGCRWARNKEQASDTTEQIRHLPCGFKVDKITLNKHERICKIQRRETKFKIIHC